MEGFLKEPVGLRDLPTASVKGSSSIISILALLTNIGSSSVRY